MCGIAGFFDRRADRKIAVERLKAMLGLIHHRGPDDQGLLVEPDLGCYVGMQRLSIIDLKTGQQPMWNENQRIAVVFNGEIYNYVELRNLLRQRGHQFRTDSDTEVLVHLYEEYGPRMTERLRGMFAFAIVDSEKRRALLARDHFGQKPLYYHASPECFAFASEAKALFALPGVPREANRKMFLDYVTWLRLPAPDTHFKEIKKLEPGHHLEVSLDRTSASQPQPFWTFQFDSDSRFASMDAAATELETVLDESVRLHLQSDVPVGVMLSGGLDSRTVGEFARHHVSSKLQTFCVAHSGDDSEGEGAKRSAEALGSDHHEVRVEPADLAEAIETVAWHFDEPVADPAAFAVLKLCRFARQHVKVLLGGEGSDELFAGYAVRYHAIERQYHRSEYIRRIKRLLPAKEWRANATRWERACYRAHRGRKAELIEARIEGLPGGTLASWGLAPHQLCRVSARAAELADRMIVPHADVLSMAQALDVRWQLPESLLMKSDKMGMAASLEVRCPFLDPVVAGVASRVPPALRLGKDVGKLVLRECLRRRLGHMPNLPKRGFPIPLDSWLRGPLRTPARDAIFAANSECLSQLDRGLLENAWTAFLEGEPLGTVFYALWLYEAWRRSFKLDVASASDPRPIAVRPATEPNIETAPVSALKQTAKPFVSILIPCYNARKWVAQAIQSALDQTWPEKEVIVVDDGSTDGSLDDIRSFGGAIRFETGPNRGGNVARNRLLQLSRGEWLQYLDADDELLPQKIEQQFREFDPSQCDVAYAPVILQHYEGGEKPREELRELPEPHDLWVELVRMWLPQTAAPLWRRSALVDVGGWKPDQPCCQELEVYFRLLLAGKRFQYCPTAGVLYRLWSTQTVWRKNPTLTLRHWLEIVDAAERHLEQKGELTEGRRDAIALVRIRWARSMYQYDRSRAREVAKIARGSHPKFSLLASTDFPRAYRWAHHLVGFGLAERIAGMARPLRKACEATVPSVNRASVDGLSSQAIGSNAR